MFYAIYMATRPRACACIFHSVSCYIYYTQDLDFESRKDRASDSLESVKVCTPHPHHCTTILTSVECIQATASLS